MNVSLQRKITQPPCAALPVKSYMKECQEPPARLRAKMELLSPFWWDSFIPYDRSV
jgi:hypothetical protein